MEKIKKWISILLMLIVILMKTAAMADHAMLNAGDDLWIANFTQMNGNLICFTGSSGELLVYDQQLKAFQKIKTYQENLGSISDGFTLSSGVYGVAQGSGTLVQLLDDNCEVPASPQNILVPLDVEWDEYYMTNFHAVNNTVYFILCSYSSENHQLCRFDIVDGVVSSVDNLGMFAFTPYTDDKVFLLQYKDENWVLAVFDFNSKVNEPLFNISYDANGFAYDANTDMLYFTDKSRLMSLKIGAEATPVSSIAFGSQFSYSEILQGKYYVSMGSGGLIYLYDLTAEVNEERLVVLGGSQYESGHKKFLLEHPQVTVDISKSIFEIGTTEDFIQGLMIGTLKYDVMRLNTTDFDLSQLIRKGYCSPITSEYASDKVAEMYPQIRDIVTQDGILYAVPTDLTVSPWENIDMHNWLSAGLTADDMPASFPEFLDFIVEWSEGYSIYALNEFGEYSNWLFTMLLNRYSAIYQSSGELLTFNTPLFSTLLKQTKETASKLKGLPVEGPSLFMYGDVLSSDVLLALPLGDDQPSLIKGNLTVYIINPQSKNIDLALDYIDNCLQNMGGREKIELFPGEAQPLERSSYQSTTSELDDEYNRLQQQLVAATEPVTIKEIELALMSVDDQRVAAESFRYEITSEQIEFYQKVMAPMLIFPAPSIFESANSEMFQSIINRYLDGSIDEQALINDLDNKIRIMQLEGNM